MEYLIYLIYYGGISIVILLISAFVAGYYGDEIGLKDAQGAILWPITIFTLLGTLIRVLIETKKEKSKNKGK